MARLTYLKFYCFYSYKTAKLYKIRKVMQKFIYFIFIVGLFQTCQWLKVKDVNPEQEIRIIGKIQDAFVKWEDTPEYIRKQVILNLTYNPNDPFKGHAGRINNADQSIKPF